MYAKPAPFHPSSDNGTADPYPSGYATWIADVLLTADYHGDRWVAGTPYTLSYGNTYGQYEPWYVFRRLNEHYYDGSNTELETQAIASGNLFRTEIAALGTPYAVNSVWSYTRGLADDYILNGATDSKTAVVGMALLGSYAADSNPLNPASGAISDEATSREAAYNMMAYMQAERCGEAHRARTEAMVRIVLADVGETVSFVRDDNGATNSSGTLADGGHIEQWLGDYITDSDGVYVSGTSNFVTHDYAPFMGGLSAYSLIYHYEHATQNGTHQGGNNSSTLTVDDGAWVDDFLVGRTVNNVTDGSTGTITANSGGTVTATLSGGTDNDWDSGDTYEIVGTLDGGSIDADDDTIPKLIRLADATWNEAWEVVPDSGTFYLRPSQSQEAMSLNNLISQYYWWLYAKTGQSRFLNRADEMFNATNGYSTLVYRGVATQVYLSKEFNELTRFTFDGLDWRAAAVGLHGD